MCGNARTERRRISGCDCAWLLHRVCLETADKRHADSEYQQQLDDQVRAPQHCAVLHSALPLHPIFSISDHTTDRTGVPASCTAAAGCPRCAFTFCTGSMLSSNVNLQDERFLTNMERAAEVKRLRLSYRAPNFGYSQSLLDHTYLGLEKDYQHHNYDIRRGPLVCIALCCSGCGVVFFCP